jgi:putative transposase
MLFVLDGSEALRKAVRAVFGEVPVQRYLWHKERNVLQHLPSATGRQSRPDAQGLAGDRLPARSSTHPARRRARPHPHPGAAGSLRGGMQETLTVTRLGITGKLGRTLESTNPAESMIDTLRTIQRNVKHWSSAR